MKKIHEFAVKPLFMQFLLKDGQRLDINIGYAAVNMGTINLKFQYLSLICPIVCSEFEVESRGPPKGKLSKSQKDTRNNHKPDPAKDKNSGKVSAL